VSLAIKQARFATQGGLSGDVGAGGLFSFAKKIGGFALRQASGLVPGGRTAFDVGASFFGKKGRGAPGSQRAKEVAFRLKGLVPPSGNVPSPGVGGFIERLLPGGATGFQSLACPSGFHPNKSSYFTQAGFVEKGSRCVKNRRRNPMNPRALDRAISRVDSGKRLQHKLASITTAKFTSGGKRKHPHD